MVGDVRVGQDDGNPLVPSDLLDQGVARVDPVAHARRELVLDGYGKLEDGLQGSVGSPVR